MAAAVANAAELFARQAAAYKLFRPTYPPALYTAILRYAAAQGNAGRDVAADVACGSGQASVDLAKLFKHTIGVDASAQQVANAPVIPGVTFQQGTAEATNLAPASCDLVAVATALHWFDLPAFYKEAARVLKPRGTLAIWTYGLGTPACPAADSATNAAVARAFLDTYSGTLGPYWDARRAHVDALYAGLEPPSGPGSAFTAVERQSLELQKPMPIDGLGAYVTTWSAHATYMKKHGVEAGSSDDPAIALANKLKSLLAGVGPDPSLTFTWPMTLILATRAQ